MIDTPGHPDFIAEVERVLGALDGAALAEHGHAVLAAYVAGVGGAVPLRLRLRTDQNPLHRKEYLLRVTRRTY